jgi:hypothetical protein
MMLGDGRGRRWRVAATMLTLTKIRDAAPDRQTVFWGVWKRK